MAICTHFIFAFLKKKWHIICCFSDIELKFSGHVAFYIPSSSEEKSEYMVLQNCGYIGISEKYCKGYKIPCVSYMRLNFDGSAAFH